MRLMRNEFIRQKKPHMPVITIIILTLTLAVIIIVSSYINVNRGHQQANRQLLREGAILLHEFERRALSEILLALVSGEEWKTYLQGLAEDIGSEADIEYILIADKNGGIVIHSQRNKIGGVVNLESATDGKVIDEGKRIFEIVQPFRLPMNELYVKIPLRHRELVEENSIEFALKSHWVLIGLSMQQYDEIHAEEINHTIIMGIILLIVGLGALYFIVIVQNHYIQQLRHEQELNIAADIQKKLFPQELPQNMGLQIAAVNIMARSVGGDYYDFITNNRGQLDLVVGDSMGKGMPAALLMTTVRTVWQSWSATGTKSPGETLEMINQVVYSDMKATEAFVTMFNALYDPVTSVFQYSNAGHNPPIFRPSPDSECRTLDVGGTLVGIFPDSKFSYDEFSIHKDDIIVIYTDGVVEATGKDDTPFGFERLCSLIDQNHRLDAEGIKNAILSELDTYTSG
ncbi:MAG: PP2C family protein-serine/threonine phosphatase, partial [Candidatus Poribacteria bacterium]